MKRILQTLSQKWPEYLLEILVLIIGIYGAFALDNWNDERKESRETSKFLLALKYELELDTTAVHERLAGYRQINQRMVRIKNILDNNQSLDKEEHNLLMYNISEIEILTPVNKNIEKNDVMLTKGILENIDIELNRDYLAYLDYTQYTNDMVKKFGEHLQHMVLQDVYPQVDLDYTVNDQDQTTPKVHFKTEELRASRDFKNAINRSILYRNVHIRRSTSQIELASSILSRINALLEN
jgi:hypothetical protein